MFPEFFKTAKYISGYFYIRLLYSEVHTYCDGEGSDELKHVIQEKLICEFKITQRGGKCNRKLESSRSEEGKNSFSYFLGLV